MNWKILRIGQEDFSKGVYRSFIERSMGAASEIYRVTKRYVGDREIYGGKKRNIEGGNRYMRGQVDIRSVRDT